ncbi:MAG: hypothetical protein ABJA60_04555 [Nitrosospira sp.]
MWTITGTLIVLMLAGCGSPPKAPTVKGEYRPINKITDARIAERRGERVFNFVFEGDIVDSLIALQARQPQIKVKPPIGKAFPLPVRIELQGVVLEDALQAIGEQGANIADVVWLPTNNEVFIRYRASYKPLYK